MHDVFKELGQVPGEGCLWGERVSEEFLENKCFPSIAAWRLLWTLAFSNHRAAC